MRPNRPSKQKSRGEVRRGETEASLTATATAWLVLGKPDIGMTLNGCLAGLVATRSLTAKGKPNQLTHQHPCDSCRSLPEQPYEIACHFPRS